MCGLLQGGSTPKWITLQTLAHAFMEFDSETDVMNSSKGEAYFKRSSQDEWGGTLKLSEPNLVLNLGDLNLVDLMQL